MIDQVVMAASQLDPASSPWIGNVITPIIVLGLIIGRVLVPGQELKRAERQIDERDKKIEEQDKALAALHEVVAGQVVPALTLATEALKESAIEGAIRRRST